jgi:hypothetical protein
VFWLSHHHADELDRCFQLGGVHVCARCLGTYPVMFAAIAAQLALKAPLEHALDLPIALGLIGPALADWAWGCLEVSTCIYRSRCRPCSSPKWRW